MCLAVIYSVRGLMAIAFVYMYKTVEARQTIVDLYNNLPDGVIVLKPTNKPKETNYAPEIIAGDVGAVHYEMLYCNERTDLFF